MRKLKYLIFPIIIILLVIGAVMLVKKRKQEIAHLETPQKPVYVVNGAIIKRGAIAETRDFIGKVEADNTINVSTKMAGYILKLNITEGQKVRKGDIIAVIDSKPIKLSIQSLQTNIQTLNTQLQALEIQLQAAKTAMETARNTYNRDLKLYKRKAIAKEKLEMSLTNYEKAKANYKQIIASIENTRNKIKQTYDQIEMKQNDLNYTYIKAPTNGVVSKVLMKEGNLAVAGKPIAVIQTDGDYKILFSYPPNLDIQKGDRVIIKSNEGDFEATIAKIYPATDKNGLNIAEVRINRLPNDVKVNSLVNLSAITKEIEGYIVPNNSILHLTDKSYIIITKDGKFTKIPVRILASNEKYSVIEGEGISEGMPVAVATESKLRVLALGVKGKILVGKEEQNVSLNE